MTFLQPYILFALPLIALPILIHLINQNRHKTIHWAATMFLVQAKRMSKGIARLRYLLIMLARMLAIAGLIFAVSRPMAGGWLGLTSGSAPETTIIVLDRSVSMEQKGPGTSLSKRETALEKLSQLLAETGGDSRLILFETTSLEPLELTSAADLADLPQTGPTSMASDIPSLLQSVADYVIANESGRTDIWVCSDLRQNDWDPSGGRWEAIRSQLSDREGLRFYLLSYPEVSPSNLAVSVSGVHRRETSGGAELVMDLKLTRDSNEEIDRAVPISFVINGARSTLDVEIAGTEMVRNGYTIPIDRESKEGWGRLEIPGDDNPGDNSYELTYAEPATQQTVIVSDDPDNTELFRLAAQTPVDRTLTYETVTMSSSETAALPWDETALILWQAPLPDAAIAAQLEAFVRSGRTVIFFPPGIPTDAEFLGAKWGDWIESSEVDGFSVERWRTDSDLLANSMSGTPLPVGEIVVRKYCDLEAVESTMLAQLGDGVPLLSRVVTTQGAAYFCTTLPMSPHSNLADNGIVFFIMTHRALASGAAVLGASRNLIAGATSFQDVSDWVPLDDSTSEVLVSQRPFNSGVYQSKDSLVAINRPLAEDTGAIVSEESLEQVLSGLNYVIIDDQAGSQSALANEVWRTFLIAMIIALLLEAVLCLPDRETAATTITQTPVMTSV
ncbi:BatA domain-containing protein [Thalassoglobus sp. JC818]|uniref:BatA domain-containing protein n=1 Tax=Thalassoglobus sp. JC818 TaxID=3232136 RepID=UPI003458C062